ncbi:hypothetical protein [Cohnella terricola]|uniref:Uncharacterized protein n=1 Tax=Cohnella terricola TaxID=1289167 RepID=A0A559JXH0_9BACL|nr:hypothetical protein [Cohnella terricola]TVY04583.1 hypothetical protein FPZ45_03160 [Cohnella terricola]
MNLADMLCYSDIAELKKIAQTYDCPSGGHSKNELIQSILATVQRRDVLESRVGEMTGSDLRFLNSLVFENRKAYSLEELKARAQDGVSAKSSPASETLAVPSVSEPLNRRVRKTKKPEEKPPPGPEEMARLSISRFKNYGWLFNGVSQQTRTLYQVPEDVKSRLRDALEKRYRSTLVIMDEPQAYRDERSLLADDVVSFLRFARNYALPLTSEGVIYKRQLMQALELLSVTEALPTRGGWRFGYGRHYRDYPDRFSLLYDFAYFEGYLVEQPDHLELTSEGRDIANGLVKPDPAKMYKFWLRLYKSAIPNLSSLAQWIVRLSAEWATIESLQRILLPLVRAFYYDTPTDIVEARVIRMMVHLGVLRWGETEDGVQVVKATPQGKIFVSGQSLAIEESIDLSKR